MWDFALIERWSSNDSMKISSARKTRHAVAFQGQRRILSRTSSKIQISARHPTSCSSNLGRRRSIEVVQLSSLLLRQPDAVLKQLSAIAERYRGPGVCPRN